MSLLRIEGVGRTYTKWMSEARVAHPTGLVTIDVAGACYGKTTRKTHEQLRMRLLVPRDLALVVHIIGQRRINRTPYRENANASPTNGDFSHETPLFNYNM